MIHTFRRNHRRRAPPRPVPALTPARDLDVLDHVTRDPAKGSKRRPGWRVAVSHGNKAHERFFRDLDHGSPYDALRAAVEWRDSLVNRLNHQARGLRSVEPGTPSRPLGVQFQTRESNGHTYRVAVADLPPTDTKGRRKRVRSVDKYGPVEALRQCAQARFDAMRDLYGDEYPYTSADQLLTDVLAAEGVPPEA